MLVLTGPPGAGKTVLVQLEAIAVATEQDPFSSRFIHLYRLECLSSHHFPHHFLNHGRCDRSSMLYLCHLCVMLLISLQPRVDTTVGTTVCVVFCFVFSSMVNKLDEWLKRLLLSALQAVVQVLATELNCEILEWQAPVPTLWHEHKHNNANHQSTAGEITSSICQLPFTIRLLNN